MRKLLVLSCLFFGLWSCKKSDDTRVVSNYGKAIDSMGLAYNQTYLFFFERSNGSVTTIDSDRVIFRSNGTVTEVANRYDPLSNTYPDTLTYTVNTSFDYNINWSQIPNALVFSFYPIHDSVRGYLLHDYLNNSVVSAYRIKDDHSTLQTNFIVTHAVSDSSSYVTGYYKKIKK